MLKDMNEYDKNIVDLVKNILPENINILGVPYDVKARTLKYIQPYFELALLFENHDMQKFNVVPLSTSTIPRHIVIDTRILGQHIMNFKGNLDVSNQKEEIWNSLFKVKNKAFKSRSGMEFYGTIRTDGISVSVLLQKKPNEKYGVKSLKKVKEDDKKSYFQHNLNEIDDNRVQIKEIFYIAWVVMEKN
jgi:hypothetical protein